MSNVQPSLNPMPSFRCQGLHAPERMFLSAVKQALEVYAVPLTDPSQGPSVLPIYDNLLFGTAPSPDAYLIIRGCTRWGGFSIRVDEGGNALQITAYTTDSDGCRHDLGSLGTVLQCQGSRLFYRHPAAYLETLQIITEAAATPGAVYLCTASRGCPKVSGSI